ncbi:MAG: bifunctional nuclease family protein [Elusimicrobiales bacterium]
MEEHAKPQKEVRIYSLATTASDAIVFLEEVGGIRLLPIWIGPIEGQAIAIKFSGIPLPRPFTHDLLLSIIKQTGYTVEKITIDSLRESTFYATIHIKKDGDAKDIDSRPSDAIALAVRAGAPIFVAEEVFAQSQVLNKPISEDEVKQFKDQLKDIKPKDIFGTLKSGGEPPPPPEKPGEPGKP